MPSRSYLWPHSVFFMGFTMSFPAEEKIKDKEKIKLLKWVRCQHPVLLLCNKYPSVGVLFSLHVNSLNNLPTPLNSSFQ